MLKKKHLLLFALAGIWSGINLSAQPSWEMKTAEDSLKSLFHRLGSTTEDSLKIELNARVVHLLRNTLLLPPSFDYPFDSIKQMGKLAAPDKKFRIYLWNLRMQNGTYRYYGFIQQTPGQHANVTSLIDRSDSIMEPETQLLTPENWYGALYYKIIPVETGHSKTVYTLLGWDGINTLLTQKLIDILTFKENGEIQFGAPLFLDYAANQNMRIIFRYSCEASMILKFDDQTLINTKHWNPRKREFENTTKQAPIIVCDRLIPLDPQLEGLYQHYVPASDVYDGFLLEGSKWHYIKGIDVRNKN